MSAIIIAENSFFSRKYFHLILITVLGLLVYSNTLHVPFQWDDSVFIEENPIVRDLDYFLNPSKAKGTVFYGAFKSRYVGYLTFALNYALDGFDTKGYHLLNIVIHISNALLLYVFILLTFRTPFLADGNLAARSKYLALFSALLFVAHPVQTEAVTYIFQRLASLVSLFYLLAIVCYIRSRLSQKNVSAGAFYFLSLISALLAMKTKENAFTLPLVVVLYEFLFFTGPARRRMLRLVPLLLIALIIPLTLSGLDRPMDDVVRGVVPATRGYHGLSRVEYLLTQFRVIITYIRLLFLPVNQNLDYDYPISQSFFEPTVFLSFMVHLALVSSALLLLFRSRTKEREMRLMAFGIFWFYITLSVESSIVPIHMVIDEYRLYLPSSGAIMAFIAIIFLFREKTRQVKLQKAIIIVLTIIPLTLALATLKRNSVWLTKVSLWEDVVKKSPLKPRPHNALCISYLSEGLSGKAIEQCLIAIDLKPDYAMAYYNLSLAYESGGFTDKAIEQFLHAVELQPDYQKAYYNLGTIFESRGLTDKAIEYYLVAVELKPDFQEAHYNLANAYMSQSLTDKAIEHYQIVIKLFPDYPEAYNNLGIAYGRLAMYKEAVESYTHAITVKPDYVPAYFNLGIAYIKLSDKASALKVYERLKSLDPQLAERLLNVIYK